MTDSNDTQQVEQLKESWGRIQQEVGKVIIGQTGILEQLFVTMLARGHCLLVGVPGLAKTLMISTLSQALDLQFHRVQFTPDLMPSDITGTEIIEEDLTTGHKAFKFVRGPVFANIVLADEINRTPPKTQAALLEAMQERHVTISGETHHLPAPFFVLATQNPIEQEGTYPLPEAQLDRFMMNLWVGYPSPEEERTIVKTTTSAYQADVRQVLTGDEIEGFQKLVRRVPVADSVVDYAVKFTGATRPDYNTPPEFVKEWISWGAGPRASQYLILGAKARAILHGRPTPDIDDVRAMIRPVLRHRLVLNFNAEAEGVDVSTVLDRLLEVVE
jgi:MoxR-like ATPase